MRRGRRRFSEQQKVIVKQTGTDNQSLKQKPASRPTVGERVEESLQSPLHDGGYSSRRETGTADRWGRQLDFWGITER